MKAIVIGGSGFIGTRLVRDLIAAGWDVTIADIRPSPAYPDRAVECDVRVAARVAEVCRGADVVYNLAAVHGDDEPRREAYFDTNVGGAAALCEAAAAIGLPRIVFTSSVAVYGSWEKPIDESTEFRPESAYGESKLEAEKVYLAWQRGGAGRTLAMVRPTAVFGPGNRANIYRLMALAVRGPRVFPGTGTNRKSVAYVENVAAFLAHLARSSMPVLIANYADQPTPPLREFVQMVCDAAGCGSARQAWLGRGPAALAAVIARVGGSLGIDRLRVLAARIGKFESSSHIVTTVVPSTGFTPPVSLDEALRRTLANDGLDAPLPARG